jgi:hypothetical protein
MLDSYAFKQAVTENLFPLSVDILVKETEVGIANLFFESANR